MLSLLVLANAHTAAEWVTLGGTPAFVLAVIGGAIGWKNNTDEGSDPMEGLVTGLVLGAGAGVLLGVLSGATVVQ